MSDFLCASGHLFAEPRKFNERDYDASGHIRDETFVECPVCGLDFEEFTTAWGIAVLKILWDEFQRGEHYELVVGQMGDLIQQLHDVEVG